MLYFVAENKLPLKFEISGKLSNQEHFLHKRRILDSFVILLVCEGTLYITQREIKHCISANQFLILFPGQEHYGWKESEQALSYYWCHFQVENQQYQLLKEADLKKLSPLSGYYILPETGELRSVERTSLIFRQILDLSMQQNYSEYLTNYAISLLAMEISQQYLDGSLNRQLPGAKIHYQINEIREWIDSYYNTDLTVQKIADRFHYNPDYLSALFKKHTGSPLLKYIIHTRISVAKQLLLNSSAPIRQIALDCGFHDEKHFMKLFRQIEGMTPTQYRNAFYRKNVNRL